MSGQFDQGPPITDPGVWLVCLGIWTFVPDAATHTDLSLARRQLHRIELERLEAFVAAGVDCGGT